ncbi:NPC1-like intracellular cholesterol transporter 1 [Branchiostoma floridae]|uniref:NPC1-like intracellular cholesterol transporter 1 n=1 Tax=Branchiostoma floridae TaxID=7739 RepID=A0A9J7NBT0_BRAFL|nr:NPC1-like intracellular cholesterol transporter 1 [Branchiostoma floridae]
MWVNSIKNSTLLGSDGHATDSDTFHQWILQFLTTDATGRSHAGDVKLNVTTSPPTVMASRMRGTYRTLQDSTEEIQAMDSLIAGTDSVGFSAEAFPYMFRFPTYETNKVIQSELYRNLGIAMAAVFVITLLLLADFMGSLWVLLCVVMTLVDVGGMLHHWGLTIDTVTTNIMVIAIGLAVDYATHICHTFLIVGGTRQERALLTLSNMGPAVFNGGFSTFLAIVLLASSQHYVFITFFKVFFLVLLFGCLHGLVFLPVILSWLGPAPYDTAPVRDTAPAQDSEQSDKRYIRKVQTQGFVNPGLEMDGDVRTGVPENRSDVVPCVMSRPEYPPDIPSPDYNVSPASTIRHIANTGNSVHGHAEATVQWGSRNKIPEVNQLDVRIDNMITAANQKLFLLRRLKRCGVSTEDLTTVYTAYVRPSVEYAMPVWYNSVTAAQSEKLERVQKRVCRIILGMQYTDYMSALSTLNISSLAERRERLDLCN